MKTKVQNWTNMSIFHRTVSHKKIWNAPLDALMFPLQIMNDIESLSLTLHGVNAHFIHPPSNVKNYLIGHKSETAQSKKNSLIRGWGDLSKMSKQMSKMSIIELSQLGQDLFDISDLTWAHPLTLLSTHRYLQTKSNNISISSNFIKLVIWPDPTHSPTHWSIHPPIGTGVSTNHKSSNRIELSQLGQDLFNI